jgi:hypothetical protein
VCANFVFVLHSTNPDVYQYPPPLFDKAAESAVFGQIVHTFTWLPATATPTLTPILPDTATPSETPTPFGTPTPSDTPSPSGT